MAMRGPLVDGRGNGNPRMDVRSSGSTCGNVNGDGRPVGGWERQW